MGRQWTVRRPHHDARPRPRLCRLKPVLLDSRLIQPKNAQSRAHTMSIPDYQSLMLPLLRYVAENERRVREAIDFLADQFSLTEEERNHRLPSGRTQTFKSRVHWAGTFLSQAAVLRRPRKGYLEITSRGREVLAENL